MLASAVSLRCTNRGREPAEQHRHVYLVDGRAGAAERYPEGLITAILAALRLRLQRKGALSVNAVDVHVGETV